MASNTSSASEQREQKNYLDVHLPALWLKERSFGQLELHLRDLYQKNRANPTYEYKLILTYEVLAGSYATTSTQVEEWIKQRPGSPQALLVRALQQEKKEHDADEHRKNLAPVYADLNAVLKKMPDHPVAHYVYVKVLCTQRGISCVEEIIPLQNKKAPDAYFARRELLTFLKPEWGADGWMLGEYMKASQSGIKKHTLWRPLLGYEDYLSCSKNYQEKKYIEALPFCEKALSFGEDILYLKKLADTYVQLGDFAQAKNIVKRLPSDFPSNYWDETIQAYVKWFGRRAKSLDAQGKTTIAIQAYNEALALRPNDTDTLTQRAIAYSSLNQWPLAEKDLHAVIAIDPNNYSAFIQLDYALAYQKRFDEIVILWKDYLSRNPQKAEAYFELGGTYFNLGDYKNAYQVAQKACDLGHKEGCQRASQMKARLN